MEKNDQELLNKVIRAWNRVNKRKAESKNVVAKDPYTRWVLDRVKVIKLPFEVDADYNPDVSDSPPMSLEEIDIFEERFKQAQREKEELELNLYNLTKEKRKMQCIL